MKERIGSLDLVVGIGNRLRGDDGLGPRIAERLALQADVETISVLQITPDLASSLAEARRVLFVDADAAGDRLRMERLNVQSVRRGGLGHSMRPVEVLEWTQIAYGRRPEAWVLAVPGRQFALSEDLSPEAEASVPVAVAMAWEWVKGGTEARSEEEDL
jgi:hydrogenase maturation protease